MSGCLGLEFVRTQEFVTAERQDPMNRPSWSAPILPRAMQAYRMMLVLCALGVLGTLAGGVAGANPNELSGAVLVAHYVADLSYSSDPPPEGWCAAYAPHAIGTLGEAVPTIYGQEVPAVWYVLAAWESEAKTWCGMEFGFAAYDPAGFDFASWGPCYPATGLELPTPAWPGPGEGTAFVTTATAWSGNWEPVYYFTGYASYTPGVQTAIPLAADPPTEFVGSANCLNPPTTFAIETMQRGALGINTPGTVPIFPPPVEAVCCLPSGACEILTETDCLAVAGEWLWSLDSCDPNPCPGEEYVCCFASGGCSLLDLETCNVLGGTWHPEWSSCEPNPCPQPSVCCVAGACEIVYSTQACSDLGGIHHPEWAECTPNPCPAVCCFNDGSCQVIHTGNCSAQGGTWRPDLGDRCEPNPCPQPHVCCIYDECLLAMSASECLAHPGGTYHPEWSSCDPNPCTAEPYVCCFSDGTCQLLTRAACMQAGGIWRPSLGQSCTPNPCPQPRACCIYNECLLVLTAAECLAHPGGVHHPEWTSCDPNPCPQRAYVCCVDGGACLVLTEPECLQAGGVWRPQWGQSCSPNPCPQEARVCCLEGNACQILTQSDCAQAGGQWRPDLGESCEPNPCDLPPGPHNLQDGALFVHYVPELAYTTDPPPEGWCRAFETYPVAGIDDLNTRIDVQDRLAATWYVLAAWDGEDRTWCGVEFGFGTYDQNLFVFSEFSSCYPAGGLELPSGGWPGPGEGTALVTTGTPWEGNWEPVYFFGGYAYGYEAPDQIPIATDPVTGFVGFCNCQMPPQIFAVDPAQRGALGINTDGYPPGGPASEKACCLPSTECQLAGLYECNLLGGIWHPEWNSCEPNPCPPEAFVCCFNDGSCSLLTQSDCEQAGAHWLPELGRSCDPNPCPRPSICCIYGECLVVFGPEECYAHPGGTYYPTWETCDPNPCPQGAYVCCLEGGACAVLTHAACLQAGGQWRPDLGQSCIPNPCNEGYAVCCQGLVCTITLLGECQGMGGDWHPEWTSCDPNPCDFYVPTERVTWGRIKRMFR